ncbi:MAG TPA: DUF5110 domain-containing protein [Clostridiales bacterium]|nr:DUF5110 domain-containing protein [Clostridiales bacterium]
MEYTNPVQNEKYTITSQNVRITLITPSLFRIEKTKNGLFCDNATQSVICRNFSAVPCEIRRNDRDIFIKTSKLEFHFSYEKKELISIKFPNKPVITDFTSENLKGTTRTLDLTIGKTKIGDGVISKNGVAILDDSDSLVFNGDKIEKRAADESDIYYFAYQNDYRAALRDYYKLTGIVPLIPRYALSNWWSRYYAYTQDEYIELMQRFIDEKIPITVATVDMDWHWTDVTRRFGQKAQTFDFGNIESLFYDLILPGWTGYSWNTELFPDPKAFLTWLKDKGFKITLNVHPSAGIKFFEDDYAEFCKNMGIENTGERIKFDITDPDFVKAYFEVLHHPKERDGVDFWWIDWQQGKNSKVPGLDPLWALNHYHFLDSEKNNKRGLILSRFAGAGSHRYPLGFSGDTAQNWKCLDFQPYFTATAANIGYTWWSHDIGGHCNGVRDDELYLRWLQFGIFSPVNRLHSSSNEFMGKEPWKYKTSVCRISTEFMRLRHKMLPYIYSINYQTHKNGIALCEPMYYEYPNDENAYKVPNQYHFGSELIVSPITSPANKKLNLAAADVWIPNGRYTDIFTGDIYNGNRKLKMFRDEESIPVLAKAGAIIPLNADGYTNNFSNPENMEIWAYRGNGSFEMFEDDGITKNYQKGACAFTNFSISGNNKDVIFTIAKPFGDLTVLPEKRSYSVIFKDITDFESAVITRNGEEIQPDISRKKGCIIVNLPYSEHAGFEIKLKNITAKNNGDKRERLVNLYSRIQMRNNPKLALLPFMKGKLKPVGILKDAVAEIDALYE